MQFTYFLAIVATLGRLTQAQLPNLPGCSLNCFLSALQNDGCSSLTNFTCHCAVPSLVGAITPCVQRACDLSDQSSVSDAVTSVCSSASVPISVPPVTGTTTGSAATTTSSGSAAAGSTTPSRTPCSGKSSTSASSSGTGGAGSASSGSTTSTSGVTSAASASTSTSTGTGTTGTTTTGVPRATGAAGLVSVPFVGTGLFAMGIAALFAL